ncbi:carboxylate-amine ligase [Cellulomonas shaoxiangyii]|uniref:Putative glutamate--cysteine ligase 2 n=1 Tax=Cellulomonas shaoxiangyii TaxID=2566013 RepID=A0A4V1CMK5_9CELL|nr:glutamate--cysteine ligase [Cellulomonas shaoxiangyii]QCB93265.1 YbdK family carboxylate-amine ligase [Cellulomonas shaoxiangyii]TGY83715.1 YbdK family carboxylate-amine ligase [Cellulomonas shaoxiangyii]
MRTVGVEEEFLLVGPDGAPVGAAGAAVRAYELRTGGEDDESEPGGGLEGELKEEQLETGTHPCEDLGALADEVRAGRRRATAAARAVGVRLAAVATSPVAGDSSLAHGARYHRMAQEYALTAREQLTSGCHVHVAVADDDEGVAVIDRIAPWLPVLLALSTNSPYWRGEDSGYSSFRSQVWSRWPTAGPTAPFGSVAGYRQVVEGLLATGAALDHGMLYFDARLSHRYPTVEIRVADVCLRADDAVLVAALARGLVETAARDAAAGVPPVTARIEQLRAATWRSGRSGLTGDLVAPPRFVPAPARDVVRALLEHVRPVLTEDGDVQRVEGLLDSLWVRGSGAAQQRAWFRAGGPQGVVDGAVAATAD